MKSPCFKFHDVNQPEFFIDHYNLESVYRLFSAKKEKEKEEEVFIDHWIQFIDMAFIRSYWLRSDDSTCGDEEVRSKGSLKG